MIFSREEYPALTGVPRAYQSTPHFDTKRVVWGSGVALWRVPRGFARDFLVAWRRVGGPTGAVHAEQQGCATFPERV